VRPWLRDADCDGTVLNGARARVRAPWLIGGWRAMADWDAQAYRQISGLQQWLASEALAGISLRGHERVLDVGCGDGRITVAIAEQFPAGSVLGIDVSPRMVRAAKTLVPPESTRVQFEIGDVLGMSFRDEFDIVVSFNALHWVTDQIDALRRIRSALHDSGWALVQQVCRGPRPSLEETAMRICQEPAWRGYFAGFQSPFRHVDANTYPQLVAQAGLEVDELSVADLTWDFDSPEAFARWCRVGFAAWNTRLASNAAIDALVAEVLAAYTSVSGTPQRFQFLQMRVRLRPTRPGGENSQSRGA
jgi:trans-aconitate 2-methyltransferase